MNNQTSLVVTPPAPPHAVNRFVYRGVNLLRAYATRDRATVRRLANEYLLAAERNVDSRNYGNAIHQANTILGLLELEAGSVSTAEQYLVAAGNTPGSAQLTGFGPNMLLAKKLLEAGRSSTVLGYLDRCGKFWKLSFGRIWMWKLDIRRGRTPNFGANLSHLLDPKSFG